MHPEGIFAPHWYLLGALLARANDSPLDPGTKVSSLFEELAGSDLFSDQHKFNPISFRDALDQCINWGLIAPGYREGAIESVAISPLGTYLMTTDREMRVGHQRPQILALPDGADHAVFMIQMGYEEIRQRNPLNPYRNLVSAYSLGVPGSEVFEKLDLALEAIRSSNSINAELRDTVLEKLAEGRRRWKAGPIAIALLAALILNPLQNALDAVTEEVLKPQIQAAAEFIKKVTGI